MADGSSSSMDDGAQAQPQRQSLPLTADVVMDRAGVYDLLAMKELVLRDEELTELEPSCAQSLASLEILSLSHNRLSSLENFQHFGNLIELNVNFNQISTLENLQCSGLEKLFIANNQVTDISPLRSLLKLNTISVYGNLIADLDASLHTCRGLPKLRALDLGGNPCSRELEGYKFQVVRVLPRLKTLDGDHVTQLDKDLAEEFFAKAHRGSRSGNNGSIGVRPFTAPAGARGILTTDPTSGGPSNGFDPFASKLMPRGNVRLFRDDFLNNHPILLEYLVQDARGTSPLDAEHAVNQTQLKFASEEDSEEAISSPGTSSFVDKMRNANPLSGVKDETSDLEAKDQAAPKEARGLKQRLPSTLNVPTSHLCVDPSDPSTTIRKLLKHIEILMETLASHKNHGLDACSEELLEENKQLQTENNNIPILQEQIEDLKKKLAVVGGNPDSIRLVETKRVKSLEHENASLKRENGRLKDLLLRRTKETEQSLKALQSPRVPSDAAVAGNSMNQDDSVPEPMRLSHSELLDESASIDVELTELILQNEVSLELIRNDIKNTKKEWEEQFQKAKAAERAQVRPQTSLGLSIYEQKPRMNLNAACSTAQNGGARRRQLHTSAGFRMGPEAQLLGQTAVHPLTSGRESGSRESSTTNILTL